MLVVHVVQIVKLVPIQRFARSVMQITRFLEMCVLHVLHRVSAVQLLRTVWNVNQRITSQAGPTSVLVVWLIAHPAPMLINVILVRTVYTSTVNMKINEGISCTSCGTYCRECDQNSGVCKKCLEGFMILDGTCVQCTGSICSCETLSQFKIIYT